MADALLETYLSLLDSAYDEVGPAFKGLADDHVWKRPTSNLLSVGELAGHIAYWEGGWFTGDEESPMPNPEMCSVRSPLIDTRFASYATTLTSPPSEEHLAMSAQDVYTELMRVHRESSAYFREYDPDLSAAPSSRNGWAYGAKVRYLIFHVSYHTGQIYSARHLLGEHTPDN